MYSDEDDVKISSCRGATTTEKLTLDKDVNDSDLEFSEALAAAVRGEGRSTGGRERVGRSRERSGVVDRGTTIDDHRWRERVSVTPDVVSTSDLLYSRLSPSNYGSEGLEMFTPSSSRNLSRGSIESSLARPNLSELESGWGSQEAIESIVDDRLYQVHTRDRGMLNYDSDDRSDYGPNMTNIIGMDENRGNRIVRRFGDIEEAEIEVEPSSLESPSINSLINNTNNDDDRKDGEAFKVQRYLSESRIRSRGKGATIISSTKEIRSRSK